VLESCYSIKLTASAGLGRRKGTADPLQVHLPDPSLSLIKLIRSPTFNRAVQKAYRKMHRLPDLEQKNGGSTFISSQYTGRRLLIAFQERALPPSTTSETR
jgi:hypothetical protein